MRAFDQQRRLAGRLAVLDERGPLSVGRPRWFAAGQQLLANGGSSSHAVLITRGLIRVTARMRDPWGNEIAETLLSIRGPGDFLGEEGAVLGDHPVGYMHHGGIEVIRAIAITDGAARSFPTWKFRQLLDDHPAILRAVTEGLCRRLADTEARIAFAPGTNIHHRLARLLCDLERHGEFDEEKGGTRLPGKFSQAELASWIGSSLAGVDRSLNNLRRRGIISTGHRVIVVHDLEQLARIAGVEVSRRSWGWPTPTARQLP